MDEDRPKPRHEKPISLHPLTVEEALKQAMAAGKPKTGKCPPAEPPADVDEIGSDAEDA